MAAAADLQYALEELVAEFHRQHPALRVTVSYGSSGNFYSQLLNRVPFDLYFSADLHYPQELERQGLTLPGSQFTYAIGRIVLWVPAASELEVERLGLESLLQPAARHIAIANPRHAPYGRAAEAALRAAGIFEHVRDKLIFGESVAQALQFVHSGAADAGIIALSLARAPAIAGSGRYWEIPVDSYPRMEQGGVILRWARNPEHAWRLRSFVQSAPGRAILHRYGFFLPESE